MHRLRAVVLSAAVRVAVLPAPAARVHAPALRAAISTSSAALSRGRLFAKGADRHPLSAQPDPKDPPREFLHELTLQDFADPRLNGEPNLLVARALSVELADGANRLRAQKADMVNQFRRFKGDTGSSEVQVAVMTARINNLTEHLRRAGKDMHNKRRLNMLVLRRKRLMLYMKKSDYARYREVVLALGLKDVSTGRPRKLGLTAVEVKTMKAMAKQGQRGAKSVAAVLNQGGGGGGGSSRRTA